MCIVILCTNLQAPSFHISQLEKNIKQLTFDLVCFFLPTCSKSIFPDLWESLDINRYTLKNYVTDDIVTKHLNKDEESDQNNFRDLGSNAELEIQEKVSLLEWFTNEYKNFGCTLEFVINKSQEGSHFCRGFSGIGGILRYQLYMRTFH